MQPFRRKVDCRYGAPMGRGSDALISGKLHLAQVPLDSGGYDPGGAYWGHGIGLWCAWNDNSTVYLRARDRTEAKQLIPAMYTEDFKVSFYR